MQVFWVQTQVGKSIYIYIYIRVTNLKTLHHLIQPVKRCETNKTLRRKHDATMFSKCEGSECCEWLIAPPSESKKAAERGKCVATLRFIMLMPLLWSQHRFAAARVLFFPIASLLADLFNSIFSTDRDPALQIKLASNTQVLETCSFQGLS